MTGDQRGEAWLSSVGGTKKAKPVADALVEILPRDALFSLRFLGESRLRLLEHFQAYIMTQLAAVGATPQTHPMLHAFAETHAMTLRDFVVSSVEVMHQFSLEHIEKLTGDASRLMRVEIWDHLKSHVEDAEAQFTRQIANSRDELERYRAPGGAE